MPPIPTEGSLQKSAALGARLRALDPERLIHIGYGSFLAGTIAALLVASPVAWIPSPLLKLALFSVGLAVAAACLLAARLKDASRPIEFPEPLAVFAVALLPIAYAISFGFSIDKVVGFLGGAGEVDTLFFVLAGFFAWLFAFFYIRSSLRLRRLMRVVAGALWAAIAFQFLTVTFGYSLLSTTVFGDRTVNLIGKWNDFSIAVSLALVFALVHLEFVRMVPQRRLYTVIGAGLLALFLLIINFATAWWIVLAFSLVIVKLKFFFRWSLASAARGVAQVAVPAYEQGRYAFIAIAFSIVALIGALYGAKLNTLLPSALSVSSLEVRPSIATTYDLARNSWEGSKAHMLVGTGPGTFRLDWVMHKPVEVNETNFWNVDFTTGFSTLATAFATVGMLGVLGWTLPLLLILFLFRRVWYVLPRLSERERARLISLSLATLLLWVVAVVYVPSQIIVLLAFVFLGALAGYLDSFVPMLPQTSSPMKRAAGMAALALIIMAALSFSFISLRHLGSGTYAARAQQALTNKDVAGAAKALAIAEKFERTSATLLLGTKVGLAHLQELVLSASTSPQDIDAIRLAFQSTITSTLQINRAAAQFDATDYRPFVDLAHVYEFLYPLGISGTYDGAAQAYRDAMMRSPNDPSLPLLLARLEATDNLAARADEVKELAGKALALKSNYTEAFQFLQQVALALGDFAGARDAAMQAAASAPTQAPLWLEVGQLDYQTNNLDQAIPSLQRAVALVPNYANAQYFLGLAYYKAGRTGEAVALFTQLSQNNPDNAEVKKILDNMNAGRDALYGVGAAPSYTAPKATVQKPVAPTQTKTQAPAQTQTTAPVETSAPATEPVRGSIVPTAPTSQ